MNETSTPIDEQVPSSKPIIAALAALVAITAVLSLGSAPQASAQERAAIAAPQATGIAASMHDNVDWSKVKAVPASPAQSVAAYER
jgi:hypothetical protein